MPTLANALLEGLRDHGAREIFGIPPDFTPIAMIAVGYPGRLEDLSPKLQERALAPRRRLALADIAYSGRWDNPYP